MPLKSNPQKIREWQERSRKPLKRTEFKKKSSKIKPRSKARSLQEVAYSIGHRMFIEKHPVCPVTGEPTCQVHHSAKREGRWLNLQRYWIAVSHLGHIWIEENKREAETYGLMVRINHTAETEIKILEANGISLAEPLFYKHWDGKPLL